MSRVLFYLFFSSLINFAYSQLSIGGQPYTQTARDLANGRQIDLQSALKTFSSVDNESELLRAQEIKKQCSDCKNSFYGTGIDVELDIKRDGRRFEIAGGTLWKLDVKSENAHALQFYFDKYRLPPEAELFIYNNEGFILGAFTHINNHPDQKFATATVPGELVTLEYFESGQKSFSGELSIYKIIHSFRNPSPSEDSRQRAEEFGNAWACQEDLSCYSGYDDLKEGVARISYYDNSNNLTGHCTGWLINNSHPSKPGYLITADHCLGRDDPTREWTKHRYHEWIIEFDYQKENCFSSIEPFVTKSTNGARLLTRSDKWETPGTDHALMDLEILNFADIFKVPYLGFDRSVTSPSGATLLHHAGGDTKKISFDNLPGRFLNEWQVHWETGVTQSGSSGSPLIKTSNMLVIGLLRGGYTDCSQTGPDYLPTIGYSWDKKDERFAYDLRHFLDFDFTNPQTMPSYIPPGNGGSSGPVGGGGISYCQSDQNPPHLGSPLMKLHFPRENCSDQDWIQCYHIACTDEWKLTHGETPDLCGNGVLKWNVGVGSNLGSGGMYHSFDFENDKEYIITYKISGAPSQGHSGNPISRWKFYTKSGLWTDGQDDCGHDLLASEVGWSENGLISQVERSKNDFRGWKTYASRFVPTNNANKLLVIYEADHGLTTNIANIEIFEAEYFDANICDDDPLIANTQIIGNIDARRSITAEQTTVNSSNNGQLSSIIHLQAPKMIFKDGFKVPYGSNFRTKEGRCYISNVPQHPTEISSSPVSPFSRAEESFYEVDYSEYQPLYTVSDIEIYSEEFRNVLKEVLVYPNPTRDLIKIEHEGTDNWAYSVLDLSGKTLLEGHSSQSSVEIDLTEFDEHLFIIKVTPEGKKSLTRKVFKK